MSEVVLCRICLRDNVGARDIPEFLVELHDEICDYEVNDDTFLKYCSVCEHLLRKFNEFRKLCRQANNVLIEWKQNTETMLLEDLQDQLLPFPLGFSNKSAHRKVFVYQNCYSDLDSDLDLESDLNFQSDLSFKTDNENTITRENETETMFEEFLDEDLLDKEVVDVPIINQSDFLLFVSKEEDDVIDNSNLLIKKEKAKPIVERKSKKVKILSDDKYEFDDKIVKELIEEYGENHKLVSQRRKFLRNKATLKERIVRELDTGQFHDLGDVKMTKELFNKIYDKYDINDRHLHKPDGRILPKKLKMFLLCLYRKYNPEYETVFDIEYLYTHKKKLQEFNRRKDGRSYLDAPFKCELCYKGFTAQSLLNCHNKWHIKRTPNDVVCDVCQMSFLSRRRCKAHHKNNHTVIYTCRICPTVIHKTAVMVSHYNQHKGVQYQCPTCLGIFSSLTTMNAHRRSHSSNHVCSACARCFVSKTGLELHKNLKHKDEAEANPAEAVLCKQCNITFVSQEVYLRHELTHLHPTESLYQCFFCKDGFDSIEALRKHKLDLNHQGAPKQKRRPRRKKTLSYIKRREAIFPNLSRKCPVCEKDIPNKFPTSLYIHHVEAHPGVPYTSLTAPKYYLCEQCGKSFRSRAVYISHKNMHSGAKPYACVHCPSKFSSKMLLMFHTERHRPPQYLCKQCGKMFLSAANLLAHRRIHTGDRRYKCDICLKGFLHASALKEHVNGVHNRIRRVRKQTAQEKVAEKSKKFIILKRKKDGQINES